MWKRTIYAEMSEWFKEHDWKSCVRLKRTGGSNPLLCAKKETVLPFLFFRIYGNEEGVRVVDVLRE